MNQMDLTAFAILHTAVITSGFIWSEVEEVPWVYGPYLFIYPDYNFQLMSESVIIVAIILSSVYGFVFLLKIGESTSRKLSSVFLGLLLYLGGFVLLVILCRFKMPEYHRHNFDYEL